MAMKSSTSFQRALCNSALRRHFSIKTLYTEESVPGSERTPNLHTAPLPLYVDGKKYDTRIPGFPVVPNAKEVLLSLYAKATKMCDDYGTDVYYNEFVKNNVKFRCDIVNKHDDVFKIEDEIACGQIEELIKQAKDDIETLYDYNEIILPSDGKACELGSDSEMSDDWDYDERLGEQGTRVTLENIQELLAAEEADLAEEGEDFWDQQIARRNEMDELMAARAIEADEGAASHTARNDTEGGGWRLGS